jgi:hypothetical protein
MIRVIHPDGFIEVLNAERPSISSLQELVGGQVEMVAPWMHNATPRHVLINEKAFGLGLPENPKAMALLKSRQTLCGVVLILDANDLN